MDKEIYKIGKRKLIRYGQENYKIWTRKLRYGQGNSERQ